MIEIIVKDQRIGSEPFPFPSLFTSYARELIRKQLGEKEYPRQQIASILSQYNHSIGNDECAQRNIDKLKAPNSTCIVTGQQLGLMSGPAYTIYKAITCLLLAKETQSVPIFWLATEDHDIREIDHTYILDQNGNLKKFHLSFPQDHSFVEDLQLDPQKNKQIEDFLNQLSFPLDFHSPQKHSYSETMASLMAFLFKGTGLVFLEPKLLRPLASPFFQSEIKNSEKIYGALRLNSAILFKPEDTNLFFKNDAKQRIKIRKQEEVFIVGRDCYSLNELLDLCESKPEQFSTNVAARTVLQSTLLPVLAYVAGPNERIYFEQLKDYFQFHQVPMPCIVPRLSATLLTPKAYSILEKSHLNPWDKIPLHWNHVFPDIESNLHLLTEHWTQTATNAYHEELNAKTLKKFIWENQRKITKNGWKSYLKNEGIPHNGLHFLRNFLHPHQQLQERRLNWLEFQSKSKDNLIHEFLKLAKWNESGHLYCFLKE